VTAPGSAQHQQQRLLGAAGGGALVPALDDAGAATEAGTPEADTPARRDTKA
jgi:hypothetical protein